MFGPVVRAPTGLAALVAATAHASSLRKGRANIVRKVRELRTARKLTQVELSRRLGLSQGRLSEIERGGGSFTAEQFLAICRLFNVPPSFFGATGTSPGAEVTNALARFGAHLRETEAVLPTERFEEVAAVVRETLAAADSARLVAALAPVIVANIDRLSLEKVQLDLAQAGLARRFGWLVDCTLHALRRELRDARSRAAWLGPYRRAGVVLASFLRSPRPTSDARGPLPPTCSTRASAAWRRPRRSRPRGRSRRGAGTSSPSSGQKRSPRPCGRPVSYVHDFFRDLDAAWPASSEPPIHLRIIGSTALMLLTDYDRGTKDSDVLESGQWLDLHSCANSRAHRVSGRHTTTTIADSSVARQTATCQCVGHEPYSMCHLLPRSQACASAGGPRVRPGATHR
jgi:transcriptional regulator with XRE-family HTH domain